MSVELAGLISSVTALNSVAKTVIEALKTTKRDVEVGEFQKAILEANSFALAVQQQQFSLAARVQELEKDNTRLKDWSAEKEKYLVREIADGVFAYVEKGFVGDLRSAQKLCCNCFNQQFPSILQEFKGAFKGRGMVTILTCPKCKTEVGFFMYNQEPPTPPPMQATPINPFQ